MKYLLILFTLLGAGCANQAHAPDKQSSAQSSTHTFTHEAGTTRFIVGNLCDAEVSFSLTTLQHNGSPSVNFGITPDKMLGFSVISKNSDKSKIEHHKLAPFQRTTIKNIPNANVNDNPLDWFRKFRIDAQTNGQIGDPNDSTQWLRKRRGRDVIYTFFACKP